MKKYLSYFCVLLMTILLTACGSKKEESPNVNAAEVNMPAEPTQEVEEQTAQCEHNWCPAAAYWDDEYSNGTIQKLADNEYVCSICGQRAVFPNGYFNKEIEENTEPPVSTPNPNHEWIAIEEPYLCADGNRVNIVVGYSCSKCGIVWYAPEEALLPPDVGDDHVHDWSPKKTGYNTNLFDSYICKICGLIDSEHGPNYGEILPPTFLIDEEILASTNRFANP